MGKRTKARECAFQMLYQWDIDAEPMDRVTRPVLAGAGRHATRRRRMAERLARGAQGDLARLDQADRARRPPTGGFERIAAVDRNILRIGVLRADAGAGDAVGRHHRRGGGDGQALRRGGLAGVRERRAGRGASAALREKEAARSAEPSAMSDRPRRPPAGLAGGVGTAPGEGPGAAGPGRRSLSEPLRAHATAWREIVAAYGREDARGAGGARGAGAHRRPGAHAGAATARRPSRRSRDGEARLQVYVRADEVGERAYQILDLARPRRFRGRRRAPSCARARASCRCRRRS